MDSTSKSRRALLIVDFQNDFCPGGALPVPSGDAISSVLNRVAAEVPLVVASRDWHPEHHVSFAERGGPWPPHCVQESWGAELHSTLGRNRIARLFDKGTDPDRDAYSAFHGTGLAGWLRERGVEELLIGGLATDYCVRASVLDAREAGFAVTVIEDAVGAVDVQPGDGRRALGEMRSHGARVASSSGLQLD